MVDGSILSRLPAEFWDVEYVGDRYPGSPAVTARPGLDAGANCQLYAYAVLRQLGLEPPDLRSSDLWSDASATARVTVPKPLDLVLVSRSADAWGAHVGVWAADDQILHLCAEVARPAVWTMADFVARERYRVLVGFKRVQV